LGGVARLPGGFLGMLTAQIVSSSQGTFVAQHGTALLGPHQTRVLPWVLLGILRGILLGILLGILGDPQPGMMVGGATATGQQLGTAAIERR